jgi:hypothetical protein
MRKFHVQTIDNVSGQIVYVMAAVIVQIILNMKVSEWFYWTSILNFERSLSLFPKPQSSLVRPCIISSGGPDSDYSMRIRFGLAYGA